MRDYTLAVGMDEPYGFSASDDGAAVRHAGDYFMAHGHGGGVQGQIVLSGPDGLLSVPGEDAAAFCARIETAHRLELTDDVKPADPTPPDCNMA